MAKDPVNFDKYKETLEQSGIIDQSELEDVLTEFTELSSSPSDSQILADKLVEKELITPWQNQHLLQTTPMSNQLSCQFNQVASFPMHLAFVGFALKSSNVMPRDNSEISSFAAV